MGIHPRSRCKLASADDSFPYGRLPVIRPGCRRPSFDQRRVARHDRRSPVSDFATVDRRHLVRRVCGSGVCRSSVAGGISRLGCRAQGCVERVFLHAYAGGVYALCPPSLVPGPLSAGAGPVRLRFDVQAHAGDAADCPVPARLLAVESVPPRAGKRFGHSPVFSHPAAIDPGQPLSDAPAGELPTLSAPKCCTASPSGSPRGQTPQSAGPRTARAAAPGSRRKSPGSLPHGSSAGRRCCAAAGRVPA